MTESDGFDITFKCIACGEQLFWEENLRDDQAVTCPNCGRDNPTLGELKATALEAAMKAGDDIAGEPLDWKPE
jgi:predicted nucleic-acid-binding Zn-ribbon protein